MDTEFIINSSLLFLKFLKEEWNIFVSDIPPVEMTPAQLQLYKEIKANIANRRTKVLQLAELQKRLDLLLLNEDKPEFEKIIKIYKTTIEQMRRNPK